MITLKSPFKKSFLKTNMFIKMLVLDGWFKKLTLGETSKQKNPNGKFKTSSSKFKENENSSCYHNINEDLENSTCIWKFQV